ncbi:MAG: energy-coupling factor transporter ATPase [Thermoplasmata archaeon]
MSEKAVELINFYWRYPTFTEEMGDYTLKNINLEIYKGEFFGITGPTGSGKTTLCYSIAGLIPHQVKVPLDKINEHMSGKILVFGEPVSEIVTTENTVKIVGKHTMAPTIGIVMQDPENQFLTMSVLSELSLGLQIMGLDKKEIETRIKDALERVGLEDLYNVASKIHPSELSGGQKQRLIIASFLAMHPKILILDEPTSDLDPAGKMEVIQAIAKLKERGDITVILVEHDPEIMKKFVDRMAVIYNGEIVAINTPDKIYSDPKTKNYIEIPDILNMKEEEIINSVDVNIARTFRVSRVIKESGTLAIDVKNLQFTYTDGTKAINGLDLKVNKGEFIALIGQNGSGKTTLSKILSGYETGWSGYVRVLDMDIKKKSVRSELPRYLGYVFQNPDHQIFNRSVHNEIEYGLKNLGIPKDESENIIKYTLQKVGLYTKLDEDPLFLSRGEKRRLAVASVMAMKPEILIVDEPTTGQDYRMSREIMEILDEMNKDGRTIIVITHDMRLVAEYCRRVMVMKRGKIIFDGLPEELFVNEELLKDSSLIAPQSVRISKKLKDAGVIQDLLINARDWFEFFKFEKEKKRYVALKFDMLKHYAKQLAKEILEKYGTPESIIYIERGGMVIGRLLSDYLQVKEVIGIRASYYLEDGTPSTAVNIGSFEYLPITQNGYILLVDDIADTGKTLEQVLKKIREKVNKKIVVATIAFKPQSIVKPDVYAYTVDNETWIIFDYEENETKLRFLKRNNENGLQFMRESFP